MGRFLDVDAAAVPDALRLVEGDVVRFSATGGLVRSGDAVELLGVLQHGVVVPDGTVLVPAGPPAVVLFRARGPGSAVVAVVEPVTDPWRAAPPREVAVLVAPS